MHVRWSVPVGITLLVVLVVGVGTVVGDASSDHSTPPTTAGQNERRLPGQLYSPGEGALWTRSHLTLAEQQLIDNGDPTNPAGNATQRLEAAISHQAAFAEAHVASARLGIGSIEETGVVP